ncbi:hypothetical protein B484DRAFT_401100 [Ochromonadaceae sp. CCMP2298]|nr:hypothetical protein B484DRAFT_401100 [Ochromonadaceae sp. CCMP2298]
MWTEDDTKELYTFAIDELTSKHCTANKTGAAVALKAAGMAVDIGAKGSKGGEERDGKQSQEMNNKKDQVKQMRKRDEDDQVAEREERTSLWLSSEKSAESIMEGKLDEVITASTSSNNLLQELLKKLQDK